ncbi:MAG: cell division protein FtsL [Clostridium sp.]|uniref:cell division protein FtsL n=1 Tax=Clostridium sp. TaxID=1506 RepID=UPI0026716460|nr:cell division protein FtsL [Clostridium sp.]MCI7030768.1 cell division protein FtsL [Clostridium sp.]MDD7681494.1 cell division protein FtsL [Clostridium sp.]MDY2579879.1 cell division protein FtsL [Clostridium sp.]
MGAREYNYTRGNTALVPERKPQYDKNKKQKIKEELRAKKIKKLKVNLISNVVGISALVCILGGITLAIDGYVYDRQNELTQIKEEAEVSSDINDALKVMLLKYSSLENVKNVAENELSMVYPNKDNTIMIDMSKDYFSHISEEENGESFLDKIKGIFN